MSAECIDWWAMGMSVAALLLGILNLWLQTEKGQAWLRSL